MKKFLTDTFTQVIYYGLLVALVFATFTGQNNILSVAASAFWVVIALGAVIGPLTLFLAYGAGQVSDKKTAAEALATVKKITRRKNAIARWWGWICMVLTIVLLAYSGWVFTAVSYALSSLFIRFCVSLARDKVEKQEGAALA
ncbi:hypothetical protein CIW60_09665 [Enterobacter roggenkampii]|uniref:hypothetical protein n=1 Tax=Enterobacter roggenkampii TaxID=1812935 RepID=UPI000BA83890|nr:hypothetical protein [Enterobacter roggenkampii]PAO10845.1 hypothetical protein CIW60_09665 [Enterobacter roggenkampii]WFC79324.1 hypothetical protein OM095_05380 [Enterobacter roggenkampii]